MWYNDQCVYSVILQKNIGYYSILTTFNDLEILFNISFILSQPSSIIRIQCIRKSMCIVIHCYIRNVCVSIRYYLTLFRCCVHHWWYSMMIFILFLLHYSHSNLTIHSYSSIHSIVCVFVEPCYNLEKIIRMQPMTKKFPFWRKKKKKKR